MSRSQGTPTALTWAGSIGQPGKDNGGQESRFLEDGDRHRPRLPRYGRPAEAQLNTQHIKGTAGLKSGSQAPPGVCFIAPLFYIYEADEVNDRRKP